MARRRFKPLHDVAPRDALDRAAFVLLFLLGVGGSIGLKLIGTPPILIACFSAAVLILYALIAWISGRIRLEPETIGDNCYYLGFLFTLSSLAFTLYLVEGSSQNSVTPVDIQVVISGFGVALSSTIVGVFLRVLLMQLRPDFVAKDREVRADINRAFADFRKNMSGIQRQMKAFSTESVQLAAERDKRIQKFAEKAVKDQYKALSRSSDEFSASLENSMSKAIEHAMSRMANFLAEANTKNAVSIEQACRSITSLKQELQTQERESLGNLNTLREQGLSQISQEENALRSRNLELERYAESNSAATQAIMERMIPAIDTLTSRLENLQNSLAPEAAFKRSDGSSHE